MQSIIEIYAKEDLTMRYHDYHQWMVSNSTGVIASFNNQEDAITFMNSSYSVTHPVITRWSRLKSFIRRLICK